jgi:hypothetical protein
LRFTATGRVLRRFKALSASRRGDLVAWAFHMLEHEQMTVRDVPVDEPGSPYSAEAASFDESGEA